MLPDYANALFLHCKDSLHGGIALIPCGVSTDMIFTCDGQNRQDSNFTLSGAQFLRQEELEFSSMTSTSNSAGATSNPITTSTSSESFFTPSATCPTLACASTSIASDCPPRPTQDSKVVVVGAGVGVSLGLIIFLLAPLFTVEKRRNQSLVQKTRPTTTATGSYTGQTWINQQRPESPNTAPHEMSSDRTLPELSGVRIRI